MDGQEPQVYTLLFLEQPVGGRSSSKENYGVAVSAAQAKELGGGARGICHLPSPVASQTMFCPQRDLRPAARGR